MSIPNAFIQDLVSRVDIVDLIQGAGIPLKKTGVNYSACCPFHNEKTPSFTVSPSKQFYHCFGCGANGNAIGFLMQYEHLEFLDAIETLAKRTGMTIPQPTSSHAKTESQQPLYDILEKAANFYYEEMCNSAVAIDYLKKRGLTGQITKTYNLGYAPNTWDFLLNHLKDPELLVETGLAIQKEQRTYDRFRHRIMFPIRDARGRVIGFGGRVLTPEDTPKYLNSPETPVFHKGQEVYGLYELLQNRQKIDDIVIVEGYMDVIALAQHGITNAVATLGTAISQQAIERLFRRINTLVFCFDGDQAGQKAAWRALELCLPLMQDGREARFIFLPQADDPDSLVRKLGPAGFAQKLKTALPLSECLFKKLLDEYPADSMDSRAKLAHAAQPLIAKVPEGVFKNLLVDRLNKLIGQAVIPIATPQPPRLTKSTSAHMPKLSPVRQAITLLINCPLLAKNLQTDLGPLKEVKQNGIALLVELIELIQTNPTLTTASLLEHWRGAPEFEALSRLAHNHLSRESQEQQVEFQETLLHIQRIAHEERLEHLLAKAGRSELSAPERIELQQLIQASKI